jgi:hypothetical protein
LNAEVFLSFDLEFTYAAAIHLAMVNAPFPHVAEGQTYSEEADSILDEMIYKGNRLAAGRKAELTYLEILFRELAARIERRGLKTLTLSNPAQEKPESCPNEEQRAEMSSADPEDALCLRPETQPLHHLWISRRLAI